MKFNEQAKEQSHIKSLSVMQGYFRDKQAARQAISLVFKVVSIDGIPSPLGLEIIHNYRWDTKNNHVLLLTTSDKSLPISERTVVRIEFEKGRKLSDEQVAIGMTAIAHNPMKSPNATHTKTPS